MSLDRTACLQDLRKLACDRRGALAVELALLAPLLLLILAGLVDMSRLVIQSMQIRAAAQAGADYALARDYDAAAIRAAVRDATPLDVSGSPAPTQTWGCVGPDRTIAPSQPRGTCPSGRTAGEFVTVRARAAFRPLMPWPRIALPAELRAQAMVRVR
ncbi:TadE/TadG family type IV pilus assembly protein [Phenylobacterium sp.]|uniref:TadE/TadG family type IV pilus assembly protein n=1 Tax=Phenylobacterium sp. TaxID=1871053 RepID=UPI002FE20C78